MAWVLTWHLLVGCMALAQFCTKFILFYSDLFASSCWLPHHPDLKYSVEDSWQGYKFFFPMLIIHNLCNMRPNPVDQNWVSSYHIVNCYFNVALLSSFVCMCVRHFWVCDLHNRWRLSQQLVFRHHVHGPTFFPHEDRSTNVKQAKTPNNLHKNSHVTPISK